MLRQEQDRLFLIPGERAIVGLSASIDGVPRQVTVRKVELVQIEGRPPAPSKSVGGAEFHDDGIAPDLLERDETLTATLAPSPEVLGSFTGDLRLIVEIRVDGEVGAVSFPFVYTGEPPARFTGRVREALEDGSLAIHVGIEVDRPGRYLAIGRLFDTAERPVAILHFNDVIDASTHELRLLAFGKLLLDAKAAAPFVLRDVQGWRMIERGVPDRQMLEMWPGPYTTASYPSNLFSGSEWDSPSKQRRLAGLERIAGVEP